MVVFVATFRTEDGSEDVQLNVREGSVGCLGHHLGVVFLVVHLDFVFMVHPLVLFLPPLRSSRPSHHHFRPDRFRKDLRPSKGTFRRFHSVKLSRILTFALASLVRMASTFASVTFGACELRSKVRGSCDSRALNSSGELSRRHGCKSRMRLAHSMVAKSAVLVAQPGLLLEESVVKMVAQSAP